MTIKVIDSFSFFNEVELLKLRLNYLNDVVDYFVISEGKYTHSGKSKPYYLDEVLPEIGDDIKKKIIRLKYEPDIINFNFPTNINECDLGNDYLMPGLSPKNTKNRPVNTFTFIYNTMDD